MSDLRKQLEEEYAALKTRRDELRVQIDLGTKEARSAWQELDEKWSDVERKMKQLRRASADSARDIGAAAKPLLAELKKGYARIRDLL